MAKRIRKRDLIIEFLQLITGIGVKKGKKAAPRFELGIKDLQSSALPLGHAATMKSEFHQLDRISDLDNSLLVLSNGHGEDVIAMRVLEALHQLCPDLILEVLPLVGEGKVFDLAISAGWLKRNGPRSRLPSGGFSNQSFQALVADIASGLFENTWKQWRCVRDAARKGQYVLAVGDLFPLFLAWSSGAIYGFIGTPKSDYTWRSGPGTSLSDHYHCLKGTEWELWECGLMRSPRCQLVAMRDRLTARGLKRYGIKAYAPGNPMMDGLLKEDLPHSLYAYRRLLLLCGSRMPEAGINFSRLLNVVDNLNVDSSLAVLVALSSEPTLSQIEQLVREAGYMPCSSPCEAVGVQASWQKGSNLLLIGSGQFSRWARWTEVGLTTAGTATEQLVGLGIPALSFPGSGPQFKESFALRQSRLLGGAVIPCRTQEIMVQRLQLLLKERKFCEHLGSVGFGRMGSAGGSIALAEMISQLLIGVAIS